MSRSKRWMTVAFILLGTGVLLCTLSLAILGFDFRKLSTGQYVTNNYEVDGDFQNISIDADMEKIAFAASDDGRCRVECFEDERELHRVRLDGDTLVIDKPDEGWQWHFSTFLVESPEIKVYLPKDTYGALSIDGDTGDAAIPAAFTFASINVSLDTGDVTCLASASGQISIRTNTGDIAISAVTAEGMKLGSDTGEIILSDVKLSGDLDIRENTGGVSLESVSCRSFTSGGDTGEIRMVDVIAAEDLHLERDTGDIKFDGCDAGAIYVRTDTGAVTGSLLTDKIFVTETDTGSVSVPGTSSGGRCEIVTDTGDIQIEIKD